MATQQIKGKWRFNQELNLPTTSDISQEVLFTAHAEIPGYATPTFECSALYLIAAAGDVSAHIDCTFESSDKPGDETAYPATTTVYTPTLKWGQGILELELGSEVSCTMWLDFGDDPQDVSDEFYLWMLQNAVRFDRLGGIFRVNLNAAAVPFASIPYVLESGLEEDIYEEYHVELQPLNDKANNCVAYGMTPLLMRQNPGNQSYQRIFIVKVKLNGAEDFSYLTLIPMQAAAYSNITILDAHYHSTTVNWFAESSTGASAGIVYMGESLINLTPGQQLTLHCEGKLMESDLIIDAADPSSNMRMQVKRIEENGEFTPEIGYNGFSKVIVNVQAAEQTPVTYETRSVTPDNTTQKITPLTSEYLSEVTVAPIPAEYQRPSGTKYITGNGANISVAGYEYVSVAVTDATAASAIPTEVATEAEMTAILETAGSADNGRIYKYVGETGLYRQNSYYKIDVEEIEVEE